MAKSRLEDQLRTARKEAQGLRREVQRLSGGTPSRRRNGGVTLEKATSLIGAQVDQALRTAGGRP